MKISCISAQPASESADAADAYASAHAAMKAEVSRSGAAAWLRHVPAWDGAGKKAHGEPRGQASWASLTQAIGDGLGSIKAKWARRDVFAADGRAGRERHGIAGGTASARQPFFSIAEICAVLTRTTPGSHVLLLGDTKHGAAWSLASESSVATSPQHQGEAAAALHHLEKNVKDIPIGSLLAANGTPLRQVTADDLRSIADEAYQTHAQPVYRGLGPSRAPREDIPRTPTEVVIHWIDTLQWAADALGDGTQKTLAIELLAAQKARWMTHDLGIEATRNHLRQDSDRLRLAGLPQLADIACGVVPAPQRATRDDAATDRAGGLSGLAGQLPTSTALEPVAARLHDNIYGRVFESRWITHLVEKPPANVLAAMRQMAQGLVCLIDGQPAQRQPRVVKGLQKWVQGDPRFWFDATPEVKAFAQESDIAEATRILKRLLRSGIEDGYHAIAIPYLGVRLFNALVTAGDPEGADWIRRTNDNYVRHICVTTGRTEDSKVRNIPRQPSAGITLRHQPPATTGDWMVPATRPSLYARPAMSTLPESVKQQLRHGIPYVVGASGSTNIMLGIAAHLRDTVLPAIDPKDVLLGTVMFLTYGGGHSIHESLWTANQRDAELRLGLNLSPDEQPVAITDDDLVPKDDDAKALRRALGDQQYKIARRKQIQDSRFRADYDVFIKLYQGTQCGEALAQARDCAWDDTLAYFRRHSHYSH